MLGPLRPALRLLRPTCALTVKTRGCFYNANRRPEREDKLSTFEHIKNGFKVFKAESGKLKEELIERFQLDPPIYYPDDSVAFYRFDSRKTMDLFQVVTDCDNSEGFTTAEFVPTQFGTAIFKGKLDTRVPKDGKVKNAGYAVLISHPKTKSFLREQYLEWACFTHLLIRCRGDGRSYMINLSVFGEFDLQWNLVYQYPLYTRGGPYWQMTKIPFSKFFLSNKGRIQDKQCALPMIKITKIGIACADRNPGPFQLELDFIGGLIDPNHEEQFAYEDYEMPECYVPAL